MPFYHKFSIKDDTNRIVYKVITKQATTKCPLYKLIRLSLHILVEFIFFSLYNIECLQSQCFSYLFVNDNNKAEHKIKI